MKKLLSLCLCALLACCLVLPVCADDSYFGEYAGDVYTNREAGIMFTLPGGWFYADEDTLNEALDNAAGMVDNETFRATIEAGKELTVMLAGDSNGNSLNIVATNLPSAQYSILQQEGEGVLLDSVADSVEATFTQMGFTVVSKSIGSRIINGTEKKCLSIQLTYYGMELNVVQFFQVRKDFLFCVTMLAIGDDSVVADTLSHVFLS